MQVFHYVILVVMLFTLQSCSFPKISNSPDYQLNILVINENNVPLENAFVRVMFHDYSKGEFGSIIGVTDNTGIYAYSVKFARNLVEYEIRRKGYYRTMTKLSFGVLGTVYLIDAYLFLFFFLHGTHRTGYSSGNSSPGEIARVRSCSISGVLKYYFQRSVHLQLGGTRAG